MTNKELLEQFTKDMEELRQEIKETFAEMRKEQEEMVEKMMCKRLHD